jgi:hypothetical protein
MSHESLVWTAATEAAERIERTLSDAVGALDRAGVAASLVEGSALSAELSASDELIRRFASRASLSVAPSLIDRAECALVDAGWQRAAAQGDLHLLRAAARHGRHLVFALLDDDADPPDRARLHPSHPEAARQRNERLSRWRTSVRVTLARLRTYEDEFGRVVTETFELGLVEASGGAGTDPRAR